jgi:hypothetical protein|tara:strand:+ start:157 stop:288 length:132 start_codon:yes stop_codon:yes gene_type:complete
MKTALKTTVKSKGNFIAGKGKKRLDLSGFFAVMCHELFQQRKS